MNLWGSGKAGEVPCHWHKPAIPMAMAPGSLRQSDALVLELACMDTSPCARMRSVVLRNISGD